VSPRQSVPPPKGSSLPAGIACTQAPWGVGLASLLVSSGRRCPTQVSFTVTTVTSSHRRRSGAHSRRSPAQLSACQTVVRQWAQLSEQEGAPLLSSFSHLPPLAGTRGVPLAISHFFFALPSFCRGGSDFSLMLTALSPVKSVREHLRENQNRRTRATNASSS